jgi:hypothetical protein
MAKSSLPKVISKANKDIATIIENDIQKESKLLKQLVDEVLAANVEVKKRNNQRIIETRRKLKELDIEIDELNKSIDLVDRETVIEQLNHMIDAENNIFAARQQIRFFENEHVDEQLHALNLIYNELASSIEQTKRMEDAYTSLLSNANDLLFDKQLSITNEMMSLFTSLVDQKRNYTMEQITLSSDVKQRILALEQKHMTHLDELLADIATIDSTSSSIFTEVDDELLMGEKITTDHEQTMLQLEQDVQSIEEDYQTKRQDIIDQYNAYEDKVRLSFEAQNKQALEQEKLELAKKEEKLKNIRLLIIDAEKKQNFNKVQKLLKEFDKVEKQDVAKVTGRTDKLLAQETKKTKDKAIAQLLQLELKRVTDLNKREMNLELERVKYEEAKILYKIKSDRDALQGDLSINKQKLYRMQEFFTFKKQVMKELYQLKLELRLFELDIMQTNEERENTLFNTFNELVKGIADIEQKRLLALQENVSNHDIIKIKQQYQIGKAVLDLKLSRDITDIDKRILKTRNESLIHIEKEKEDAMSEIIYQESLIKIAQKERELQLKKVHSLYENERNLAEEQVERINYGIKVNDTFVKTTLQNQLLFAEQQIKCAESEFDIRVENVNLTKDQELAYATKKIDYYRQKYEYEKSKIRKERDDKLEDLNFKLLLFTDKKENESIQEQIDTLTSQYQEMIDDIDAKEQADPNIKRYEIVMDAAEQRASKAIEEAAQLRDQTVDAFNALYDQTSLKMNQIKESNHSQDTVGIMPLLNSGAVSSADDRLQLAIKEAEELYEDRIKEPNETIVKTKEALLKITEDAETEAFIQTQKELKKQKIMEHSEFLAELRIDMEEALESTTDEVERAKLIQQKMLKRQYESVANQPLYRGSETIAEDYEALRQKERDYIANTLETIEQGIKRQIADHKAVLKETSVWIKHSLKPYKKHIRRASKGHNAEKKEIVRKYNKLLKKALSEAEDSFSIDL